MLLALLLVLPSALSGALVEIGGHGGWDPADGASFSGGLELGAGASIHPRWDLGLVLASGARSDGSIFARTGAEVRSLAPRAGGRSLRPFLVAGAGIGIDDPPMPALWVGPGILSGHAGRVGWRLEGRVVTQMEAMDWKGVHTWIEAGLGLHLRARSPWDDAPSSTISITPDDALVWLPHPWCAWVEADQVASILEALPADAEIVVTSEGRLPTVVHVTPGADLEVTLDEAPRQGALVVLANPADRVRIGEHDLPLTPQGTLLANLAEGPVALEISGGGRTVHQELAVAEGWATWLRVPPPEPVEIRFGVDSSDLDAAGREVVAAIAGARGSWRFRLEGSWSTEGENARNTSLGRSRAEAVHQALVAAGVPSEALEIAPPVAPPPGPPLPQHRVCRIVPLPPEAP
ncbi:MAG: OmpA family protein [Deltaproteobacteria bacterium]|nr:OmpA family protein [Deltaproteobacteria bacterium]